MTPAEKVAEVVVDALGLDGRLDGVDRGESYGENESTVYALTSDDRVVTITVEVS